MKHITSRDNPTFKELKSLAVDVREQRRLGLALLDGIHLVAAYRDKVGRPERLILSERGATQPEIRALRDAWANLEILLLRDGLFRDLSELVNPTGVCAVIRIPTPTSTEISGSCVLLDAVQDPGNVGSILRSAAATGIGDVFLGPGCASVWSPRVLRAAQGAHFDLRLHQHADLIAILEGFPGVSIAALARGTESLYQQDLSGKLAWLFGSEGSGVAPALEAAASKRIHIPMAPGSESLNVAAAVAVCLFEEVRQKGRRSDAVNLCHFAGAVLPE